MRGDPVGALHEERVVVDAEVEGEARAITRVINWKKIPFIETNMKNRRKGYAEKSKGVLGRSSETEYSSKNQWPRSSYNKKRKYLHSFSYFLVIPLPY